MKKFLLIKSAFAQETTNFDELVGDIRPPVTAITTLNNEAGGIGIILFVSKLIQVATLVASLWVVANVILAAYTYLSGGGKADSHSKVSNMLMMSVTGLIIIVSTYTIAGLIGLLFFGDASYIINPVITEISAL